MDGPEWTWAGVAVPAGVSSSLYRWGNADLLLGVPILAAAALCAVAILTSVARRGRGGCSEDRVVRLGLLLAATLSAVGFYEVLLYELRFCAEGVGALAFAPSVGARKAYCGFLGSSGYWPAFVPAIAVLLARTAALGRGPRLPVATSVAAVLWSVLFGLLPLAPF